MHKLMQDLNQDEVGGKIDCLYLCGLHMRQITSKSIIVFFKTKTLYFLRFSEFDVSLMPF